MSGGKVIGAILGLSLASILGTTYHDYGTTMFPGTDDNKACEAIKPIPGFMDRKKHYYHSQDKRWYPCWHQN